MTFVRKSFVHFEEAYVTQLSSNQTHGSSTSTPKKTEKQFRDELDALNKQSNLLNEQRIRIQTQIERAKKEKEQIESELLAEFGTADLSKLASILAQREHANEQALQEYKEGIQKLGEEIDMVSSKLALIK
jgi:hypothetical protein